MSDPTTDDLVLALLDLRAAAASAVAGTARAAAIMAGFGLGLLYVDDLFETCEGAARTGTFGPVGELLDDVGTVVLGR